MGKARATPSTSGITLDTGALVALDRGEGRMIALLVQAVKKRQTFRIPAGVVGQAWRDGRTQATLARFLRTREVQIVPLDQFLARSCGELCSATATSDVIDASVAIVSRQFGDSIVTSDPDDLRRLYPNATIIDI